MRMIIQSLYIQYTVYIYIFDFETSDVSAMFAFQGIRCCFYVRVCAGSQASPGVRGQGPGWWELRRWLLFMGWW